VALSSKWQKVSFSAASSDVSTYSLITCDPGSDGPMGAYDSGDHVLVVCAKSSATGVAGQIEVILADADDDGNASNEGVIHRELATISPFTRRSNYDNGGGDYVGGVTFAVGGDNLKRITGAKAGKGEADGTKQPRWYVGFNSAGGLSTIDLFLYATKAL
jgi:hypothetical protein